ncbi:sulfotransferase [Paludibacterium sp.]|uniref:sulfotransferase n=1 Tax=Paludibacterium sp. TaxID=1917523 RepID=UPI0025FAFFAC|nr:sulfotransferase [Paludibacterium sp.]MBV8647737.1 sulfotransferase [Paludibacterium sp.]
MTAQAPAHPTILQDPDAPQARFLRALQALGQRQPALAAELLAPLCRNAPAISRQVIKLAWLEARAQQDDMTGAQTALESEGRQIGVGAALLRHFRANGRLQLPDDAATSPRRGNTAVKSAPAEVSEALARHFQQGESAALAEQALTLIATYPQDAFLWKLLGAAFSRMVMPHCAQAVMQQALRLQPRDPEVWNNLGNLLRVHRRLSESLQCLEQARALAPGAMLIHLNLGQALLEMRRAAEAESCFRQALQLAPQSIEALNQLANLLRPQQRFDEAQALLQTAIALDPGQAISHNNLGCVLRDRGDLAGAERQYQHARTLSPERSEIANNLAGIWHLQGRLADAEAQLRQNLRQWPGDPQACKQFSFLMRQQGRAAEAVAVYQHALAVSPRYAQLYFDLGAHLLDMGQAEAAQAPLRQSIALDPEYVASYNLLSIGLRQLGRLEEARSLLQQALDVQPRDTETLCNLGIVLGDLGQTKLAEACLRQAISFRPDEARNYLNLADALMSGGNGEEARALVDQALTLAPRQHDILASAMLMLPLRADDPRLAQADALLAERDQWTLSERIKFMLALGKAREHAKDYAGAFACYAEGNQLRASLKPYDSVADERMVDAICQVFSAPQLAAWQSPAPVSSRRTPVFIVGMPRSGSTLIEQMLSAHPQVHGAGEQYLINEFTAEASSILYGQPNPDGMARLRELGDAYLDRLWQQAPEADVICDKMPENCYHVGLIRLMLPQAKIIHSQRSPLDTCFSCFATAFQTGHDYSSSERALARRFLAYQRVMRHWHEALPGFVLDVRYEWLVRDPEVQIRRMLDAIGLPWHPDCLDFHQAARQVRTASMTQVRQPLYTSAIARWQRFAPWLGELIVLLAGEEAAWQEQLIS